MGYFDPDYFDADYFDVGGDAPDPTPVIGYSRPVPIVRPPDTDGEDLLFWIV